MLKANLLERRYYLFFTLCFLGFGILVALLTSVINYQTNFQDIDKKLCELADFEIDDKRSNLIDYITRNENLLQAISTNKLTKDVIKFNDVGKKEDLKQLFYALTVSNKDLMQLRYIDSTGMEVVRVDRRRSTGNLEIIQDDRLQDKSNRYYFIEANALNENNIWHSNIDLNIENGEIELPINPTFRIATPIYVNGESKGIIISNLMFQDVIIEATTSLNFNIYLSDGDGELIYSPRESSSWSKYLENQRSLSSLFPNEIDNILGNDIYDGHNIHSFTLNNIFRSKEKIKIILLPKTYLVEDLTSKNRVTAILIALTVLLISIPLSWTASFVPSKLQSNLNDANEEIRLQDEIIDKNVMISKADKDGNILEVSDNFLKITGYDRSEIIGKNHNILKHPKTKPGLHRSMKESIYNGDIWEGEVQDLDKFGNDFWLHLIITPRFDKNGFVRYLTGIGTNITDKKNVERMSETDPLTGLYNRRKLEEVFTTELERAKRHNNIFSIILFDIDFFKRVNDTHGHLVGDSVLVHLSELIIQNARALDSICRWGGEEFMIISTGQDINGAFSFANKLRTIVERFNFPIAQHVTISCGVVQYNSNETMEQLVKRVDDALYKAKKNGRNRVITG